MMRGAAITLLSVMLLLAIASPAYAADCGGNVACACGDRLVSDRVLSDLDSVARLECHSDGIYINTSGVTLDCNNRKIEGPGVFSGIFIEDAEDVEVRNCNLRNFHSGIFVKEHSNRTYLYNNTATDNSFAGIFLNFSIGGTIEGNTANDNGEGVGIYAIDGSGNVFTNNTANRNGRGIAVASTHNAQVLYNAANYNDRYGIYLFSAVSGLTKGNTAENNGIFGIYLLTDSDDNRIEANNIEGNAQIGLLIDASSSASITLIDNTICSNNDYDIHITSPSSPIGSRNRCDLPDGWSDTGYDNCTLKCRQSEEEPSYCHDGTPSGLCSLQQPLYCDRGVLKYNCSVCSCPIGQACENETACYKSGPNCTGSVPYGKCSPYQPLFCEEGALVSNCELCGCPQGYGCKTPEGTCYITKVCKDGTPYWTCSENRQFYCNNGTIEENCTICQCPADMRCNSSSNRCHMTACKTSSDCQGQYCFDSFCRDRKDLGLFCSSDAECSSGHCLYSKCVLCASDAECRTSETCQSGSCKAIPCPDGKLEMHTCVPYQCSSGQDCTEEQQCVNRFCSKLSCTENQVIRDHACASREFVLPDYAFWGGIGLAAILILLLFYRFRPKPEAS